MINETNKQKLKRLIQTYHQSWAEKMLASLQLSTKNGEVSIKLELQFGRPDDIKPGLAAAGHPAGAPYCLRPRRHRGPAAKELSSETVASVNACTCRCAVINADLA